MKKANSTPIADKSAKKSNANPLKGKSLPKTDSKKEDQVKTDPELEKKIADAEKVVADTQKVFADAKAKLSEAKAELRKLTGKKSKGEKGPGVISTILTLVQTADKKTGITKNQIFEKLVELFPDRAGEGMKKTISVQLPGRMSKEKKVNIVKTDKGAFYVK